MTPEQLKAIEDRWAHALASDCICDACSVEADIPALIAALKAEQAARAAELEAAFREGWMECSRPGTEYGASWARSDTRRRLTEIMEGK